MAALAVGHPTPLVLPDDSGPWTVDHLSSQYGRLEAEMKTRALFDSKRNRSGGVDKVSANMESYDVHFYDLDLNFDPTAEILTGTVTIVAEITGTSLSTMELYLNLGMNVTAVSSGGVPVSITRANSLLTINLERSYAQGETLTVVIDYWGDPACDYFGWDSYGGQPLIWTLSEPYGAQEWWPCKDLNTDKADSVALHVTVPDNLVAASNGTLDQVTVPAAGRKTYHWTERYPIATYLVAVTAHPYAVFTDQYVAAAGDTMPLEYYVVPDHLAEATAGYAIVPEMIGAFAGMFGEYPYLNEKYGHVQFLWGGGMEHQTLTSLNYGGYSQWLICHELGHQWFGDLVTCADFSHIWINEGFATWCEAYWREQHEGEAAYHDEMNNARYLGPGTIIVETPYDFSTIFNYSLSYQKASWIPHMLRHMVGETVFKASLQRLLTDHAYGSVTTADVQSAFETESGQDLNAFFQQWIYGEYYPAYALSWSAVPEGVQTRVLAKIAQTQTNTGLFTMPLDVRVSTDLGDTTFVVANSQAGQWYDFVVDGTVTGVQLDPDDWVLCTVTEEGVSAAPVVLPAVSAQLLANIPNPFNPLTAIRFRLAESMRVELAIHDVSGRLVKQLAAGSYAAGDHQVSWDGTDSAGRAVASGTYFTRLQGRGQPQVRAMTLVR